MQTRRKRRRKYAAPIGGIFVALALIGIITVVVTSINLTGRVLDNTPEKEKIQKLVLPVVMFDPIPFENPADLEMYQLLLFSMWSNLAGEQRQTYSYNESQELIVPATDLDVAAAKLFGSDLQLEHQTFSDYQTTYYYDAEKNVYNFPTAANLYVYTARVEEIESAAERDSYLVTVSYLPPQGNAWTTDFTGTTKEPNAEKSMIYVMHKVKGDYYIKALRDVATADAATDEPLLDMPVGYEN